jgi:hypothetical protein
MWIKGYWVRKSRRGRGVVTGGTGIWGVEMGKFSPNELWIARRKKGGFFYPTL